MPDDVDLDPFAHRVLGLLDELASGASWVTNGEFAREVVLAELANYLVHARQRAEAASVRDDLWARTQGIAAAVRAGRPLKEISDRLGELAIWTDEQAEHHDRQRRRLRS